MTAMILTFPARPARRETAAAPAQAGAVISMEAHRSAVRLRRTLDGVYFVTPARPSPEDSSAA